MSEQPLPANAGRATDRRRTVLDPRTDEAFERLARLAESTLDAGPVVACLFDDGHPLIKGVRGIPEHQTTRPTAGVAERFCPHRTRDHPIAVSDATDHIIAREIPALASGEAVAYLAVPLTAEGSDVRGILSIFDRQPRTWTADEVRIAQDLAASAMAEAVLRARMESTGEGSPGRADARTAADETLVRERRAATELHRVQEVSELLVSDRPLDQILEELVRAAAAAADTHMNSILLVDEEADELVLGAAIEMPGEYMEAIRRVPIGGPFAGCCGTAAQRGEPFVIEDMRTNRTWKPYRELTDRVGLRSVYSVPILSRDRRVLGTFATYFDRPHRPTREEVELARLYAHLAAVAIENANLLADARSSAAESNRLRDEARQSERRMRHILEIEPAGVIIVESSGEISFANSAAERILGVSRQDLMERRYEDERWTITTPEGKPLRREDRPIQRVMRTGRAVSDIEVTVARPHDSPVVLSVSAVPLRGAEGQIDEVVATFDDVTDRKRTERDQRFLAEASSELAEALGAGQVIDTVTRLSVPELCDWCMIFIAENGHIRHVEIHPADPDKEELARALAGYAVHTTHPIHEVIRTGEPRLLREVSDSDLEAVAVDSEHLERVRQTGAVSAMLVPLTARGRAFGAITFMSAESGRHYDEKDLALAQDFGSRSALALDNIRLYEEAQEANRTKSSFLAIMSHELRTPLTAVIGYTDLIAAEIAGPITDDQSHKLERIKASSSHLLNLIEEILQYAKIESGEERIEIERIDLDDLIRDVRSVIEPMTTKKDLDFIVSLEQPLPEVRLDRGKLHRILVNLLANAVKFTDEGEVSLTVRAEDGTLALEVRDTGIGIGPEHLEDIFEPFWQAEEAMTREKGGTGLGLTLTRRLARLLDGEVEVESTPGAGSTFTVRLPVRASDVST